MDGEVGVAADQGDSATATIVFPRPPAIAQRNSPQKSAHGEVDLKKRLDLLTMQVESLTETVKALVDASAVRGFTI